MFNLGQGPLLALGVGSGSTAAADTDTHLQSEYIGNSTRYALTNTAGASLSSSDIVVTPTTVGSITYQAYIKVRGVMLASDANTGNVQEFGLFDTNVLPGTPTGTSGKMFNHYVENPGVVGGGTNKTSAIELDIDTSVYA